MNCRNCGSKLNFPFLDLGSAPPSNAYLTRTTLHSAERWFPLRVMVCESCWLVQTEDIPHTETFFAKDYAYFSSFSKTWLEHAQQYVQVMKSRLSLGPDSKVVEIGSNDGYLLQYMQAANIPCLGVEPTTSTANVARNKGITVIEDFFGTRLANILVEDGHSADLMITNNVLAHVPDINDFLRGFSLLLKPQGVATFEFPHLFNLVKYIQFDTIYHEHYSYLSFSSVNSIFLRLGFQIFDVEKLPTHGGSLRIFTQHAKSGIHQPTYRVQELIHEESMAGMTQIAFYSDFQTKVDQIKYDLLDFLLDSKRKKLSVAAYGAAAKGNTLLNFSGVRPDLLPYVVDRNPAKQGNFLPGSRIPIVDESHLIRNQPDKVLILPWNLSDEIMKQLEYIRQWGGEFVTAVPTLETK